MNKKKIFLIMLLVSSLKISSLEAVERNFDIKQTQNASKEDIKELRERITTLDATLYQRVLDDAKISLESSKLAISLVSVASYVFILISFLLGYFGFKEMRSISEVRKKAEQDINLVRHSTLAEMYIRNGIRSEASREYEEVLRIDPNNLIAHMQLGFLYTDIYKEKAIEHCKKVTELDKDNFTAYLNWGVNLDHTTASKRDVLEIYKTAERLGEEQKIDDISLGKVKRFIGACHEYLQEWQPALSKYKEAKERLEKAKQAGLPDLINVANHWLKDLDSIIKKVESKIIS